MNWKSLESGKLGKEKKKKREKDRSLASSEKKKKNLLIYTHIRIKRYIQVGTMGRKPGV